LIHASRQNDSPFRSHFAQVGLNQGQVVSLTTDAEDGVERQVSGLTVTPFELPDGCVGAHYPEMNVLVPLWYHDQESKTPAGKAVPVRIRP
jgi:anaerobic selenocysteine-containing dehydrogenase